MSSSQKKIWILEDEAEITGVYHEVLTSKYEIKTFQNIQDFFNGLKTLTPPDLVVSDIRLPDGNFVQYLKQSGHDLKSVPYFMVSAVIDIDSLNYCLSQGAIDYLTKPFQINELVVKIDRFFQNHKPKSTDSPSNQPINESFINANLTYKESKILVVLMKELEQFVHRKEIIEKVWNHVAVHPKTLDVHLYNLRRKIEPLGFYVFSDSTGRLKLSRQNTLIE